MTRDDGRESELDPKQESIRRILVEEAVGREQAIPSSKLGRRAGISDTNGNPETRFAIRDINRKTDTPIASCSDGYFVVAKTHELREYLADLEGRMQGIRERKRLVADAFEKQGELDTPQQSIHDYGGGDDT